MKHTFSQKETILNTLYSSLNRVILYCLSRPQQLLPEQLSLLNILKVLQEKWDVTCATYNSNINFIICLMHCLCQLNSRRYMYYFSWCNIWSSHLLLVVSSMESACRREKDSARSFRSAKHPPSWLVETGRTQEEWGLAYTRNKQVLDLHLSLQGLDSTAPHRKRGKKQLSWFAFC